MSSSYLTHSFMHSVTPSHAGGTDEDDSPAGYPPTRNGRGDAGGEGAEEGGEGVAMARGVPAGGGVSSGLSAGGGACGGGGVSSGSQQVGLSL